MTFFITENYQKKMKFPVAICLLVLGANSLLRKLSTVIALWNNLAVLSKEKLMNIIHCSRAEL